MSFQVSALPAGDFAYLGYLSDEDRAAQAVHALISDGACPCRVSLEDAPEGETVFLVNYEHQPAHSPYRSRHAVFVRAGVETAKPARNTIPLMLQTRLLSIRAFDAAGNIVEADVLPGTALAECAIAVLENETVAYLHVHFAKPGCYAARIDRA
ncbi:hypothetical protein GCM10011316_11150 [Roseibium aquae]|uniref:DUF1203 domain-containing protein n=1 Tax=Roseibium aquae TaxID=1323746 RepID=A0A916WYP4_9HYPH|nr:DUF1203 domain-containing protein [Roseibium aquae]GGB40870.1 hypothetical protein GCM10011316_11150 [Roseibium aquae]